MASARARRRAINDYLMGALSRFRFAMVRVRCQIGYDGAREWPPFTRIGDPSRQRIRLTPPMTSPHHFGCNRRHLCPS